MAATPTRMDGKTVLITGATSGIGEVTALELAKQGARIGIVARNPDKAAQTTAKIRAAAPSAVVDTFLADLESLQQVRQAAGKINATYQRIDVLINNAGLMLGTTRRDGPDGYEATLTINYLSAFLLTALLFEPIARSPEARIINLSSAAHAMALPRLDDLNMHKGYTPFLAYSNTKLYMLMFTQELAKRLAAYPNITTNAVHPGVVASSFANESGGIMGFLLKLSRPLQVSNVQGAQTSIYLASAPAAQRFNGRYFVRSKPAMTFSLFASPENNHRLWEQTEQMVGETLL